MTHEPSELDDARMPPSARGAPSGWRAAIARRVGRFLGIPDLFEAVQAFDRHFRRHSDALKRHGEEIEDLQSQARVWTTMARLELDSVPRETCVSVVLATRNRAEFLTRAIASVAGQTHSHWQLVVVDDGSDDELTPALLEGFEDPRIVVVRQEHRGLSSARNAGLDRATGDYIAYLDDDNVLHPNWLRAVVWAFDLHPNSDVLLGCRIIDDWQRALGGLSGGTTGLQVPVFDREALIRGNIADIGMLAHRRSLRSARFDEDLSALEDWDLLLRLTDRRAPLMIPAIACLYTTTAPGRLSDAAHGHEKNLRRILDKLDEGTEA